MAFITGVDLEQRIAEEDEYEEPLLALPAPPVRHRSVAPGPFDLALVEQRPKDFHELLRDVTYSNDDSLEELRRMVARTRSKMDSQKKVLNGFIADVNAMQGADRSFSSSKELAALPAPNARKPLQLQDRSSSCTALTLARTPSSSSLALVPSRARGGGSLAGSSSRSPAAAAAPNPGARSTSLRGGGPSLAESRSQPTLLGSNSGGAGGLAGLLKPKEEFQALQMPARRAPPGAPGSQKLRFSASALLAGKSVGASAPSSNTAKLLPTRSMSRVGMYT